MTKKEAKKQDDLDFEVQFYEAVLKESPQFFEALAALGDIYTKIGQYEKGLAMDKKLLKLRPTDPTVLYNLACSYSLVGEVDKSLEAIKLAVDCGYDDLKYLNGDRDLENLRRDERFQQFFSKIKENLPH